MTPQKIFFKIIITGIALLNLAACGGSGVNDNGNNNGGDTTPNLSNGAPSGVLSSGTTSALLSVTTDADATCKYDTISGRDYADMVYTFSTSGGSTHSTGISGFIDGQAYNYYVRCQDGANNVNTDDYLVAFAVAIAGQSIYVDQTIAEDIFDGTYSIANRDNSGSDGNAYTSIQAAVDAMNGGDDIYLRGGIYYESAIAIPKEKDGTCSDMNCSTGSWSTIKSYTGEWAIIDGQYNARYVIGRYHTGSGSGAEGSLYLSYWKFERLEITGGGNNCFAGAISVSGGPYIIRYNYFHDNYIFNAECGSVSGGAGGNNPGGAIRGYGWHDSIVEYNYFDHNGIDYGGNDNAAHIVLFSDYRKNEIADDGYSFDGSQKWPATRNEIRYNYFTGGLIGFKYKGAQLFSGRNPDAGNGWDDTYNTWGGKIHHNIFKDINKFAIMASQDFVQIYNNIIDTVPVAITTSSGPSRQYYKIVIYNNLLQNNSEMGITRWKEDDELTYDEIFEHYGYDYNNIFDGSSTYVGYTTTYSLNIVPSFTGGEDRPHASVVYDVSNYHNQDNYFYTPTYSNLFRMGFDSYTASEFEAQIRTASPPNVYTNDENPADLLFQGSSGASQYITRGDHILEVDTTISDGGIGGSHPYLPSITLPSYVGATNPNDNAWVDGVLGLTDVNVLQAGDAGDPDWVEK